MNRDLRIRMILDVAQRVTQPLRDIAGGATRTAQALKAARDRLADLERTQSNIGSFRQLKAEVQSTGERLAAAQEQVRSLARAIQASDAPTKRMTADFAAAKRAAADLGRENSDQSARLQGLRDKLSAAGISTRDLAAHERRLRGDIAGTNREITEQERRLTAANDRAARFSQARDRFNGTTGTATGIAATGLSAVGTGTALARPLIGGLSQAVQFQSVLTDIAQKAGLTRVEAGKLGRQLLVAASASNQLPDDLQKGVDALTGLGLGAQQAVRAITPIGRAATAYNADIADLSRTVFAANNNLKVPLDQVQKTLEVLAQAGNEGGFEIRDLAQYFPQLTAAYQALGQQGVPAVGDLAAALEIAFNGTGDAASAANNLANVLQKINSPATIRAFQKNYGVDLPAALKKAYREGRTPLEAIAQITDRTLNGDLSKLGFLFEDAQVQNGLRPLIQNFRQYQAIKKTALSSNGTTDKQFAERLNDTAQQWKRLNVNAQILAIRLGTLLLPTVNRLLDAANSAAEVFKAWAERNPALAKAAVLAAAGLAGLFVVIGGLLVVVAALIGPFAIINSGLIALGVVGGVASAGLLPIIGTVAAIIAVVAALGAAVYYIYNNWGAIGAWFGRLWDGIKSVAALGLQALTTYFLNFTPLGLFIQAFGAIVAWFRGPLGQMMVSAGADIVRGIITGIVSGLVSLNKTIVGAAGKVAQWFKDRLGIRSPSRVFTEFGGFMMQGLSRGIDREQQGPINRISTLSRRLTAAVALTATPALAATDGPVDRVASGAARVQSAIVRDAADRRQAGQRAVANRAAQATPAALPPITIQIFQQPGQSGQELAKLVQQEMEAMLRRQQAAQRSSYRTDRDLDDL